MSNDQEQGPGQRRRSLALVVVGAALSVAWAGGCDSDSGDEVTRSADDDLDALIVEVASSQFAAFDAPAFGQLDVSLATLRQHLSMDAPEDEIRDAIRRDARSTLESITRVLTATHNARGLMEMAMVPATRDTLAWLQEQALADAVVDEVSRLASEFSVHVDALRQSLQRNRAARMRFGPGGHDGTPLRLISWRSRQLAQTAAGSGGELSALDSLDRCYEAARPEQDIKIIAAMNHLQALGELMQPLSTATVDTAEPALSDLDSAAASAGATTYATMSESVNRIHATSLDILRIEPEPPPYQGDSE